MAGFVLKNTLSDNGGVTRGVCKMDDQSNLTEVVETKNIVKTADMEWHIRLVIEGEDRLAHNTSSRESEVFSYSEDNDYNARLADPRMNVSDMVVNKVLLRSMHFL